MKKVIYALLLFLIIIIVCSCTGARKVKKSSENTDSLFRGKLEMLAKESETNRTKEIDSSSFTKTKETNINIFSEEGELAPIDGTKPGSFTNSEGKTITLYNTKWRTRYIRDSSSVKETELQTELSIKESEIVSLSEQIVSLEKELEISRSKENKDVNKKQWTIFSEWWFWLIILILILAGWLTYKYYTTKLNPLQVLDSIVKKKDESKLES